MAEHEPTGASLVPWAQEARRLLDMSKTASAEASAGRAMAQWRKRFDEIEPRYHSVLSLQPTNAGDMRAAMAATTEAADQGDLARAGAVLDRLTALLDQAGTLGKETDVIPAGLVARMKESFERAGARWKAGAGEARASMQAVHAVLEGEYAAVIPVLDTILQSYEQDLASLLEHAQAAQEPQAVTSTARSIRERIQVLRDEIGQDPLFDYLAQCGDPVGPAFEAALEDIASMVQA